ncbi:KdsC family phosphatase [Crocinitomix catalasitica]|uniref:KdsC family phosphatase n=1 Tax=Crocinitomix catalasitica TaxID=184607 RepID=UPI00068821FC|nr:HAD-IIIA family hydrolase [Crocinitomix catalasitica]
MNTYNRNLDYLTYQRGLTFGKLEELLAMPKVSLMEPGPDELIRVADFFGVSLEVLLRHEINKLDDVNAKDIKLIILDVDGTMTDGGMYFSENGDQIKKYNTKDGMAIKRLSKTGVQFGIISHGHKLNMVQDRANLLGIQHVYVGQDKKTHVLQQWCSTLNLQPSQVAFVGDDINDLEIMQTVGISACPNDAVLEIQKISSIILTKKGGQGCIREFIDVWFNDVK